jgi:hypothetical protein
MRNLNVRMQDLAYTRFGRAEGDRIADAVYQRMTDWAFAATDFPDFRDQVQAFAMLWQWHRTPVRIIEDDEKVSYIMQPCGSGGVLVHQGAYLPSAGRPLSVLDERSFASFAEPNFPSWCAHCAFSNRGYLRRSIPYFILEGWSEHRRWGGCAAHSYKHIALVPDETFRRVGVDPPQPKQAGAVRKRFFSDAELGELARPVVDRIVEAVVRQDAAAALDLIDRSWTAWMNLHGAYRCWYAMWVAQLTEEGGAALAEEFIRSTAWEVVATVLEDPAADDLTWLRFWRNHAGSLDIDDSRHGWLLSVGRDALVHTGLQPAAQELLAERLAAEITTGAIAAGYADRFGHLRYHDGRFQHALPRTSTPSAARGRHLGCDGTDAR